MCGYTMEELLPVVKRLTEKYTSKESTSVTYEQAGQLLGAVLYCIQAAEEGGLLGKERPAADRAYQYGYECIIQKVKRTQEAYNEMIVNFHAYGNHNYYDTVTRALPGFFRLYDVRFAPQETIITMDYPTLTAVQDQTGIHAVERYVNDIILEQRFLGRLPEDYVIAVLTRFQAGYQRQFYNICEIILRHVLGCLLIEKRLGRPVTEEEYDMFGEVVCAYGQSELALRLTALVDKLVQSEYGSDPELAAYLKSNAADFAFRLKLGAEHGKLPRIVVL